MRGLDRRRYARSLRATLRTTAAAYGYTLSIATTISLLTTIRGTPHEVELFLFVAGGLGGFAALELILSMGTNPDSDSRGQRFPFAGALNILSIPAALGSSVGIAHAIHGEMAWLLAPLIATSVYMTIVAAQVAIIERVRS